MKSRPYNVDEIRAHFPSLATTLPDGRLVAFLDGPAGTQVPQTVIDAYRDFFLHANANDGGQWRTSERVAAVATNAHRAAEDLLNAPVETVKFGANMTTLNFALSRSLAASLRPGDEIIVSMLDHDANYNPWRLLAEDHGLTVKEIRVRPDDATLDMEHYASLLSPRTKVVATGMSSNALGTINPSKEIVRLAHEYGALTVLDAVCSTPHVPVDVRALNTDFLLCSPYKFYGPHAGLLYGRAELLERFGRYKVRPAHDQWETGTPSFEGMAAVTAAIDTLAWIGREFGVQHDAEPLSGRRGEIRAAMRAIMRHERGLTKRLIDGLGDIKGITVHGITSADRLDERTSIVSFTATFATPQQIERRLGAEGIQTWSGDFYAVNAIASLGLANTGGVLRVGLMAYSTEAEVDRLLAELRTAATA